jgi:hypothetical protein
MYRHAAPWWPTTPEGDVLLFLPEAFGIFFLGLWLYAIFDVISSEEMLVRNLPKTVWLMIVIFLPDVGSIAWLLLGRPQFAGWRPGDTAYRPPPRARGPEDRDDWGTRNAPPARADEADRLRRWEEDLRRREAELGGEQKPTEEGEEGEDGSGNFDFRW